MQKRMFIRLVALLLLLQIFSSCQNQKNKVQLREGESLTSLINGIQSCFSDYEIPFHTTVDDETLQELFYIDPEDVEVYAGFYSRAITSSDNLLAVKAKEGKVENVVSGMQQRQEDIKRNFEEYLPDQYEKACTGQIVTNGDFAVFILLGDFQSDWETQYQKAEKYFFSLFSICGGSVTLFRAYTARTAKIFLKFF